MVAAADIEYGGAIQEAVDDGRGVRSAASKCPLFVQRARILNSSAQGK